MIEFASSDASLSSFICFLLFLGHNVTQVRILGIKASDSGLGNLGLNLSSPLSQPIGHGTGACPGTAQARAPFLPTVRARTSREQMLWRLGQKHAPRTSNHPWRGPDRRDCREEGRVLWSDGPGSATPYTPSASGACISSSHTH